MAKSVILPSIKWGKRKDRSQMTEMFTDDGQIKQIELDVHKSCVDDADKGVGFLLDPDDQFQGEGGHWYQLLYEKSSLPICLIGCPEVQEEQLTKTLEQIYDESFKAAKEAQYNLALKHVWADRVTWIVAMGISGALILAAMNYFGARGSG